MRHTPGPWQLFGPLSPRGKFSVDGPGQHGNIASVSAGRLRAVYSDPMPPEEAEANARLIAAAPELYDFIATLENDDGKIPDWLWKMRNELLAKVRGEDGAR